MDKLYGRIDAETFDEMTGEWRSEKECMMEIARHETTGCSYVTEGVRILELTQNAKRLFEAQERREKRRLLNFVLSHCTWKGGCLTANFR